MESVIVDMMGYDELGHTVYTKLGNGTDAFDTLYIGAEKFPQHDVYPIVVSGVL